MNYWAHILKRYPGQPWTAPAGWAGDTETDAKERAEVYIYERTDPGDRHVYKIIVTEYESEERVEIDRMAFLKALNTGVYGGS